MIQASPQGIMAEAIARTLNIGDKPQRYAAEGAQASAFAKALGLKDIDYKLFIEFLDDIDVKITHKILAKNIKIWPINV